ncbi:hypothetical protein ACLOJK_001340 [Asimina triloba]
MGWVVDVEFSPSSDLKKMLLDLKTHRRNPLPTVKRKRAYLSTPDFARSKEDKEHLAAATDPTINRSDVARGGLRRQPHEEDRAPKLVLRQCSETDANATYKCSSGLLKLGAPAVNSCHGDGSLMLIAKPGLKQVSELFEADYEFRNNQGKPHLALFIKGGKEDPKLKTFRSDAKVRLDCSLPHGFFLMIGRDLLEVEYKRNLIMGLCEVTKMSGFVRKLRINRDGFANTHCFLATTMSDDG